MKTGIPIIFIVSLSFAVIIPQTFGLSIDPFTTHIELNHVVTTEDSFVFTMDGKDLERPLGFRLHYENDDDILKVKIRDPNGNLVLTSISYYIDEYNKSISAEFTPEHEGLYQVEVINISNSTVLLNVYHGEMLTWQEIDDIQKEHGYFEQAYDPIPAILIFSFIGGSIGLTGGYFVFRRKRK